MIGQFVDNLVFAFMVSFVFFAWTPLQCVTCALTGAIVELLFEIIFSPLGYPGYNWMSQAVSDLSAQNAPSKMLWNQLSSLYLFTLVYQWDGWGSNVLFQIKDKFHRRSLLSVVNNKKRRRLLCAS